MWYWSGVLAVVRCGMVVECGVSVEVCVVLAVVWYWSVVLESMCVVC